MNKTDMEMFQSRARFILNYNNNVKNTEKIPQSFIDQFLKRYTDIDEYVLNYNQNNDEEIPEIFIDKYKKLCKDLILDLNLNLNTFTVVALFGFLQASVLYSSWSFLSFIYNKLQ